jgi:hypothetical protein
VGHGRKLPANGLQSDKETAAVHDRNSVAERKRRTMDFRRTANCVLTVCLSPGGRRKVNPNVLHRWRREFRQGTGNAFPGNGKQRWSEGRIAELERKVGQQALEIDFLKGCLQRIEEQRMLQALTGSPRSTGRSRKK